ncbi:MBL fold metallo-hydrolase [Sulfurospirillum diekertiae]|uniref:MBL fold metallo-hydrolase n=1 Tax=Sulfurospirillum diekertiae TaxID=1854492 RepID=A0AA92IYC8_9BACT|nr:MBL fold metallo-hydrolase [Sulfurospirillum diekertiae]QIR75852.1 MBL fold metallo-hydrolase [Sulfurospirillum diekertiae]
MTLTIHKGTNEIGGSCIELSTQSTTILFDYGTPLNLESTKLDFKNKKIDAIVISHPHQDHFGEITMVETYYSYLLWEAFKRAYERNKAFYRTRTACK